MSDSKRAPVEMNILHPNAFVGLCGYFRARVLLLMTPRWQDESFNNHVIALHIQNLSGFAPCLMCNYVPSITKLLERGTQQKPQILQNYFRENFVVFSIMSASSGYQSRAVDCAEARCTRVSSI